MIAMVVQMARPVGDVSGDDARRNVKLACPPLALLRGGGGAAK